MPIDFRHTERCFLYRAEQGAFRGLSLTTKAYAAYLCKLVDPVGGWLALRGKAPADAFRHQCAGALTRGDFRLLRRVVGELFDEGYLERGELVEGEFLPRADGGYVGIRNWVPAQRGMDRAATKEWHRQRDAKASALWAARAAARQLDGMGAGRFDGNAWTLDVGVESEMYGCRTSINMGDGGAVADAAQNGSGSGANAHRAGPETVAEMTPNGLENAAEVAPNGIERSPSARDSNGTNLALIPDQSGPFRICSHSAGARTREASAVPACEPGETDEASAATMLGLDCETVVPRQRRPAIARALWRYQNELRRRLDANAPALPLDDVPGGSLDAVTLRLATYSPAQCRHALDVFAAEGACLRDGGGDPLQFLNGRTNWKPEPFERAAGSTVEAVRKRHRPNANTRRAAQVERRRDIERLA